MKKTLKFKSLLSVLISTVSIQSCTPQTSVTPSISPSAVPSVVDTVKPVESIAPITSSTPVAKPSIDATPTPNETPVVSTTPSVVPSAIQTIAPVQPKTYLVPISLSSGKGTAYLTFSSNTSGKILVNFQDITDAPTKINLIDQSGNNIFSSNSFSVAMSGNFSSTFSKQPDQIIKKLQLFFANGKMTENIIDDTLLSSSPEATPIPPNPTPVKTPELPTNYPNTFIANIMVTTFAGSTSGYVDATGISARFNNPYGVATDSTGNIFVADKDNNRIRKITPAGVVTTFAGNTSGYLDGTGTAARFNTPFGVAVDNSDNVYVADTYNNRIRKITPAGIVTTLAGSTGGYLDGTGTAAKFSDPYGITVDTSGNVYVADRANNRIRKITSAGVVTTLAGSTGGYLDGTGTAAKFKNPTGVAVDHSGNVYVADKSNDRIRKITSAGVVTTFAGSSYGHVDDSSGIPALLDGAGTVAKFANPFGVSLDRLGNVYVADRSNEAIRKISPSGLVTTVAGGTNGYLDGLPMSARFNGVYGITVDTSGNIYVADAWNHRIRKIR